MDFFDDPRIRKPAAAFLMAFTTAAGSAHAGEPGDETLWKTKTFDAVVSLKQCPETGMCGYVYWANPDDTKIVDYFGDPKARSQRNDFYSAAGRKEVEALCGFQPKMNFTHDAQDDHWRGTMEMRGMGMTVNVDASKVSETELRVVTSKAFFRQTETWTRVDKDDPRYPKCKL